jgi:hypothetical protein
MGAWLQKNQDKMEKEMKKDLKTIDDVALTHDSWTSLATESYSCFTGHFISNDWQMRSVVMQTLKIEGQHTAVNIAQEILDCKSKWIDHTHEPVMVTDNAANERKAIEQELEWVRFGCYGHRINLMVKKATGIPELSKLLAKGRKLVTFLHSSTSAFAKLRDKQRLIFDMADERRTHNLKQDVPTRWNSTYEMLERLVEQTPPLMAMATDQSLPKNMRTSVKNSVYSFDEQSIAEKLVDLLKPFYMATSTVCGENSPTMHKIVILKRKLQLTVAPSPDDPAVIRNVKSVLQKEIEDRTYDDDEELLLMATVLNPFTKHLSYVTEEEKGKAQDMLLQKVKEVLNVKSPAVKVKEEPGLEREDEQQLPALPEEDVQESQDASNCKVEDASPQPSPKKMKMSFPDLDAWLMDGDMILCMGQEKQAAAETAKKEVDRYLSCVLKENTCPILARWKESNEKQKYKPGFQECHKVPEEWIIY